MSCLDQKVRISQGAFGMLVIILLFGKTLGVLIRLLCEFVRSLGGVALSLSPGSYNHAG